MRHACFHFSHFIKKKKKSLSSHHLKTSRKTPPTVMATVYGGKWTPAFCQVPVLGSTLIPSRAGLLVENALVTV